MERLHLGRLNLWHIRHLSTTPLESCFNLYDVKFWIRCKPTHNSFGGNNNQQITQ